MITTPTSSTMHSSEVSSPDKDNGINSDEDILFQMDDLTSSRSSSMYEETGANNNQPRPIDMQVRYYKPTTEAPSGLSSSVVTNDTDYLRRNIMKMRMKSIMSKELEESQQLEDILEEDIDNYLISEEEDDEIVLQSLDEDKNNCENKDYISMIPNIRRHEKDSLYSRSAPSALSYLSLLPQMLFTSSHAPALSPPHSNIVNIPPSSTDDIEEETKQDASFMISQEEEVCSDDEDFIIIEEQSSKATPTTTEKEILQNDEPTVSDSCTPVVVSIPFVPNTQQLVSNNEPKDTNTLFISQATQIPNRSYMITKEDSWNYYNNISISNNLNYHYPLLQYHNSILQPNCNQKFYDTNSPSFRSWSRSASSRYKEDNRLSLKRQQRMYEMFCYNYSRALWEQLHLGDNTYNTVAANPFILQSITENACAIKVTGLFGRLRFKDIQYHFFSPHVLFIKYFRPLKCAYVMYRNYDEMARAVSIYDKTQIRGDVIYCRPTYYGEYCKDDRVQSKTLHNDWKKKRRSRKSFRDRDLYIPETYGILQTSTISTRIITGKENPTLSESGYETNSKPPACANAQQKDLIKYILPEIQEHSFIPTHYVVVKPWRRQDRKLSQDVGYWSFNSIHMSFLNYLYNTTPSVVLLFCERRTDAYQGYAMMKSEIMDLESLSDMELTGVEPFAQFGRDFTTCERGRSWRYCCRVEWVAIQQRRLHPTGDIPNSWNKNLTIRYSRDCTIVEPNLGQRILEDFITY